MDNICVRIVVVCCAEQNWRGTMRKTLLFALLALMTFWMACERDQFRKKITIMPTQTEIEVAKATFERLKPNFDHQIINNTYNVHNIELYKHKIIEEKIQSMKESFNNTKMATATIYTYIPMNKDTILDLSMRMTTLCEINYIANRPLSPNKIMLKMNKKIITSNDIESDYEFYDFGCIETIKYNSPDKLLSFIVENPDKEVRVRLVNKNRYYFDFIIDKDMRQAIRETVELYNALLILKKAEEPPEPPDLF
jgi:hypothetical protein